MATVAELFQSMEYGPAPEADAPARAWLAAHDGAFGHFIGGTWTKVGKTFETFDPSTGKSLARVTQGTAKDVDAAVAAARKAYPAWSRLAPHARARHLYALARMVQKHARLFAVLETLDNGKPIRETRDVDVPPGISITTPDGRSWPTPSLRATAPWAWSGRSSRGTSRCSCSRGRSRRRSRPGTRSC
jgi:aldehyde dehydrogenase (NAD+)